MLLQDYLRSGKTTDHLAEEFGIKAKRHGKYPELVLFKYNQLESPMGEPIVQECRGVILNEADNWNVVARPYDKFFNYGEGHASEIEWETAKVYEKLDGSLMTLYWYKDEWHVASSGTPDAGGDINGLGITFAELFWKTWNDLGYCKPSDDRNNCYMFELMTPYNIVVVQHEESRLVLHGVRHVNGAEFEPELYADAYGWECVKTYPITNWDECVKASTELNGACSEGYIVCDMQFRRNKVKCPQYVAIHHLKEGFSPKRMLEIVRGVESDEVLAYFPQYADMIGAIREKYNTEVEAIREAYAKYKHIENQKEFALSVKDMPFAAILFGLRKGQFESIEDGLAKMQIKHLMNRLKISDVELLTIE